MPSVHLPAEATVFYRTQSAFSDPGPLAHRYAGLPTDPAQLARITRDLIIHRMEGELFGVSIPAERMHHDAETRYLDDILQLIVERDDAPLTQRREPGDRFVGVCRDFALLYCSLLRNAGIPARVRCGFANYFGSLERYSDHVVTEYWDQERGWLMADPQLTDPVIAGAFGADFDPMDVPRDRFLVAGVAWQAVRAGRVDPMMFGHWRPDHPLVGEWFVVGSVRLDLATLNKVETLLWDVWGAGAGSDAEMTDAIRELYDEVSKVTADQVPFDAARALFEGDDRLRTPRQIISLAPFNGPSRVALRP